MDNNETKETKVEEERATVENDGERSKPEATGLIDGAHEAAKRLEEANQVRAELISREEELYAKKLLGGRSEAGYVPEKPKELTPQEYAQKVQDGEINPFEVD